jgi:hypothetical protein
MSRNHDTPSPYFRPETRMVIDFFMTPPLGLDLTVNLVKSRPAKASMPLS